MAGNANYNVVLVAAVAAHHDVSTAFEFINGCFSPILQDVSIGFEFLDVRLSLETFRVTAFKLRSCCFQMNVDNPATICPPKRVDLPLVAHRIHHDQSTALFLSFNLL